MRKGSNGNLRFDDFEVWWTARNWVRKILFNWITRRPRTDADTRWWCVEDDDRLLTREACWWRYVCGSGRGKRSQSHHRSTSCRVLKRHRLRFLSTQTPVIPLQDGWRIRVLDNGVIRLLTEPAGRRRWRNNRSPYRSRGMTLLEVLVALAIFATAADQCDSCRHPTR